MLVSRVHPYLSRLTPGGSRQPAEASAFRHSEIFRRTLLLSLGVHPKAASPEPIVIVPLASRPAPLSRSISPEEPGFSTRA